MPSKYIYSLLLIGTCVCGLLHLRAQPGTIDKIIVKVNEHIVLKSELEEQFLGAQSSGAGLSQCEILKSLLDNKVLVSKAELDSIPLSDEEVEATLDNRMAYMIAQIGSEDKVRELYGRSAREIKEELRDAVRDQLLVERMRQTLIGDMRASPREVRAFFQSISATERPYYSAEVRLGQITRVTPPGKEAEAAAKEQLLGLRRRLLAGEDFTELARLYSEDPSAGRNGGRLGFFRRGELDPAYEAAALGLQPGELSMPVRSDFGYHLIELLEIKGNTYDSRHILTLIQPTERDYARSRNFLDSLRKEILEEQASFEQVAKDHSEDLQTAFRGGFFEGPEGSPWMSVDALDPLLFFVLDTMEVGTLSRPMEFTNQNGKKALRLLYYAQYKKPHEASLEADYLKLQTATLRKKQEKEVETWLQAAHKDLFIYIDPDYAHCAVYNMANRTKK